MEQTKIIAVTNRKLYERPLLDQIRRIVEKKPYAIILREKDLPEPEYEELAAQVLPVCREGGVTCILHTYAGAARRLGCKSIHMPLWLLEERVQEAPDFIRNYGFQDVGVSTHSLEDAQKAEALGATYVTAGHIFVTDCKKGLEPRGLEFLKNVCDGVKIPVFAIGGIHPFNQEEPIKAGAAGVCMMSDFAR